MLARVLWYALSVIRPGGPGLRESPLAGLVSHPKEEEKEKKRLCVVSGESQKAAVV